MDQPIIRYGLEEASPIEILGIPGLRPAEAGVNVTDGGLSSWGLREGDRITAINGMSIARAEDALEALQKFPGKHVVTFDLLRESRPMRITINRALVDSRNLPL